MPSFGDHLVPESTQDSKTGPFSAHTWAIQTQISLYIYMFKTVQNKKEQVKCSDTYPRGHHHLITQGHVTELHNYSKKSNNENHKNFIGNLCIFTLRVHLTGSSKGIKWVIYSPSCCFYGSLNLKGLRKRNFSFSPNSFKGSVSPHFFHSRNWQSSYSPTCLT